MSVEITTAMVRSFSSNVIHLAQQKGSRLRNAGIRVESQNAEKASYDRYGSVEMQEVVGRHADTQYQDTPHSRRTVSMRPFTYADLVDKSDKVKVIHEPTSQYAMAGQMAAGRKIDDIIISAALGNAYADKEGSTPVALPDSQKIAAFDGTTTSGVKLNIETLIRTKGKFWDNDADDEQLYFVVTGRQLEDLLNDEKLTSNDYASVKALVRGEIDSFMGFQFIRSQRLPRPSANVTYDVNDGAVGSGAGTLPAASARRCFAYQGSTMLLAIGEDVEAKIEQLPTKNYSWQVFLKMQMGATRMEEERVVEVDVLES